MLWGTLLKYWKFYLKSCSAHCTVMFSFILSEKFVGSISISNSPKICGFHGTYVRTLRLSVDPCTVSVWKGKGGGNLFSRNTCPTGLPVLSHHRSDKQVKIKGGDRLQKRGKEIPLVSWPTFQLHCTAIMNVLITLALTWHDKVIFSD